MAIKIQHILGVSILAILAGYRQQRRAAHGPLVVRLRSWPSSVVRGRPGLQRCRPGGHACKLAKGVRTLWGHAIEGR